MILKKVYILRGGGAKANLEKGYILIFFYDGFPKGTLQDGTWRSATLTEMKHDGVSRHPLADGVVEGPGPEPLGGRRGAGVRGRARGEPGQLLPGDGHPGDGGQEGEGGEEDGGEHGGQGGGHWRESGPPPPYTQPARPAKSLHTG